MFDEEIYRKLFVEESRENHENIVTNLLALESGEDQQTAIDEIFRSAHTLKGMSASMGFDAMEHLCHSMEDVFSLIRSGRQEVTASLTDLLLTCTDTIEGMLDAIETVGWFGVFFSFLEVSLPCRLAKLEVALVCFKI